MPPVLHDLEPTAEMIARGVRQLRRSIGTEDRYVGGDPEVVAEIYRDMVAASLESRAGSATGRGERGSRQSDVPAPESSLP